MGGARGVSWGLKASLSSAWSGGWGGVAAPSLPPFPLALWLSLAGHAVQRILVERCMRGPRGRRCVVWSVGFLSDGTIVSADSAGRLQFWDSETGTLRQTHPLSSAAVLSLAVSEVGEAVGRHSGFVRGGGRRGRGRPQRAAGGSLGAKVLSQPPARPPPSLRRRRTASSWAPRRGRCSSSSGCRLRWGALSTGGCRPSPFTTTPMMCGQWRTPRQP